MNKSTATIKYEWQNVTHPNGFAHVYGKALTKQFMEMYARPAIYRWITSDEETTYVYVGEASDLGKRINRYQRRTGIQVALKRKLKKLKPRLEELNITSFVINGSDHGERILETTFGRRLIENHLLFVYLSDSAKQVLNKKLEDRKQRN